MTLKIINIKSENNCFSVILEKPTGFSFYAGQYVDLVLPIKDHDKRGKTRPFTVSSSPTEGFLMITTRHGVSDFKKSMAKLKPGDIVTTSHLAGTFILDETEPAVFIAGGIGITPFRSMIKYAVDQKLSTPITLIYSNSTDDFLFKKELDAWQRVYPKLEIIYVVTNHDGRLTQIPNTKYQLPIYYLAGPPKMVDHFEKILLSLGVDETNIRYDRFDGY